MQARWFPVWLGVLLLLAGAVAAGEGQLKQDPPQPLPKELVAAWQKAGAKPGFMWLDSTGFLHFEEQPTGLAGAVPAFQFSGWKNGVVARLPVPSVSFGLRLSFTPVDDAGLKEVAKLRSLHTLQLGDTKVTDAGLKELAGLKSLDTLDLYGTEVTDAGLKQLAALKSLHAPRRNTAD